MYSSKEGFSLVELLVVMAIMITLGGVGYQAMSGHKVTARDTARKETLGNIQEALNAYYSKNSFYPQPALRFNATDPTDFEGEGAIKDYRNVWGFRPDKEALPSCKLVWDSANNAIAEGTGEDFACGGLIKDRSGTVVIGWKGTLTEFSGKNSVAKKEDAYINPISDRDSIVAPFDITYFDGTQMDPTFGSVDQFRELGMGNIIYSAYRKGIDLDNNKYLDVGASQYQLAATLENSGEPTDLTTYVIGNYVRKVKPYKTKIADEEKDTYMPYSLIGSKNMVLMEGQKIGEAPTAESCPTEDSYSADIGAPCAIEDFEHENVEAFDGTDITSGYMGVPYPVVF